MKTIKSVIKPYYCHISFDGKFIIDFEFLVKILIPPTYFEISVILVNCVSNTFDYLVGLKSQKTLNFYFAPQRHHVMKLRKKNFRIVVFYTKIAMIFKFLSFQPPNGLSSSGKIFTFKISIWIFSRKLRRWDSNSRIFIGLSDMLFQMKRSK